MEECEELALVSLCVVNAVAAARRRRRKRSRAVWIKPWLANRECEGAFHKLVKELELHDQEHYKNFFRMDLEAFEELVVKLEPLIRKKDTRMRRSISPAEQLAVTLRFLATGESYTSLQYQFRINKGTLSLLIPRVCAAIAEVLADCIRCPSSVKQWEDIAESFLVRWQLPNCLGAIDGKHVRIRHPPCSGSDYFNYKGYFSIVLMAVVGANSEFIYADVGCQGRISDGGVLRNTDFNLALEQGKLDIPPPKQLPMDDANCDDWNPIIPHFFVGDDAFSLRPNIMKPYPNRGQTEEQRIYNYRLSRARRVSENAFGILSSKFRVFHSTLCVTPDHATTIVHATLVLRNFLLCKCPNIYTPSGYVDVPNDEGDIIDGDWRENVTPNNIRNIPVPGSNYTRRAGDIRDCLCEYVNGPGQVSWQWKILLP